VPERPKEAEGTAASFQTFYDALAQLSGGLTIVVEEERPTSAAERLRGSGGGDGLVRYSRLLAAVQAVVAVSSPSLNIRQSIIKR
jgi:hypothetical protein